ncbi:MAG TPA: alpha/beta hydrolase-fold protein [Candidatus Binatia bacterium]|nr:alpha/beta hydrolase-fold protein [Candidatus Binatia bacterium]
MTTLFLAVAIPSHAQSDGEPVVIGKRVQIHSRVLKETRSLLIATPDGYDQETDRYPVLYLLDGEENFVHAAGIAQFLAESERIPPMLVVAVANTERVRDLTPRTEVEIEVRFHPKNGGADAFLQFVSSELIPYVDQHYRTRPYKILVGHSLGGLFAVYALASNPRLFNAYIVIDPTLSWNNRSVLSKVEDTLKGTKELPSDLYITATEESGAALASVHRLCETLEERPIKGLRWTFKQMPGETHTSIVHPSMYSGLDRIFDGWHLASPLTLYDEGGLDAVHRHFADGSRRYGYNRKTPAFTVSLLVAALIAQDRLEEAAAVVLHDAKTYPAPWNQLEALARSYAQRGDKQQAIHYYTLSLEANPNNEVARKKLGELEVTKP